MKIELEAGKYGKVNSPGTISSGGLGPCIAIGAYDISKKCGYMLHVAQPDIDYIYVYDPFLQLLHSCARQQDLIIYISGGSYERHDQEQEKEDMRNSRAFVKKTIRQQFPHAKIKFNWGKRDTTTELYLNESGKFSIKRSKNR